MPLPYLRNEDKRQKAKESQDDRQQNNERLEREREINAFVAKEIPNAVRSVTKLIEHEVKDPHKVVHLNYWDETSPYMLMQYNKLPNKMSAIRLNVGTLLQALGKMRSKYPGWNFELEFHDSTKQRPKNIVVRKN